MEEITPENQPPQNLPKNETKKTETQQIEIQTAIPEIINPPKNTIKLELVVAFLSLFISVFTFVITALQTNIMQKQQKASVWAYLEATVNISSEGFSVDVHNKGVGAARVKDVTYILNGKKFKNFEELAKIAVNDTSFNYDFYSTNPINKKVFAPTEKIRVFSVKNMKYASKIINQKIDFEIVYTNIYGDEEVFKTF